MSAVTRAATCLACVCLGCALVLGLAGGQEGPGGGKAKKEKGPKGDKEGWGKKNPEEKAILKSAEKAMRPPKQGDTERDKWIKELNKFYAGLSPGLTEADFGQWFAVLAAGGAEWRRADAPDKKIAELFDRAAERLGLAGVPSIRRGEFLDYAMRFLLPGSSPPWKPPADPLKEADKIFRQLDKDQSGFLEEEEWPDRLRAVARRHDRNRDGRIDPGEYRDYFEGRVATTIEFGPEPPAPAPQEAAQPLVMRPSVAIRYGHLPKGLPAWFEELDFDRDGQIALHEWRKAGRPLDEFMAMDSNGDGLLPPDEYLRLPRPLPAAGAEGSADALRLP